MVLPNFKPRCAAGRTMQHSGGLPSSKTCSKTPRLHLCSQASTLLLPQKCRSGFKINYHFGAFVHLHICVTHADQHFCGNGVHSTGTQQRLHHSFMAPIFQPQTGQLWRFLLGFQWSICANGSFGQQRKHTLKMLLHRCHKGLTEWVMQNSLLRSSIGSHPAVFSFILIHQQQVMEFFNAVSIIECENPLLLRLTESTAGCYRASRKSTKGRATQSQ